MATMAARIHKETSAADGETCSVKKSILRIEKRERLSNVCVGGVKK